MGLLTETLLIMIFNTNSSYLIFFTSNYLNINNNVIVIGRKLSTGLIGIYLQCNVIDSMTMSRCYGYHDCTNVVVQIKKIASKKS